MCPQYTDAPSTCLIRNIIPNSLVIRQNLFLFKNNTKNLDLSYKTDLDFWYCFGRSFLSKNNLINLDTSYKRELDYTYCYFREGKPFVVELLRKIFGVILVRENPVW